jgi:hypothetical protein
MNIAETKPFAINLLTEPYDNVHEFEGLVLNAYATAGTAYDAGGLFHLVASDAQWAAENTVAGVVAPRPNFELPAEPAGNAGPAVLAQYNSRVKRFETIQECVQGIKAKTIASIGEANVSVLSHPRTLMRGYTDRQILDLMILKYGTPTAMSIQKHKDYLLAMIKDDEDFDVFAAKHRKWHVKLELAAQPVSEFDKCDKLQKATASRSNVSEAIRTFKVANPRVDQLADLRRSSGSCK